MLLTVPPDPLVDKYTDPVVHPKDGQIVERGADLVR